MARNTFLSNLSLVAQRKNYFPSLKRFIEKYFTHAVGSPLQTSKFYKYVTPAGGLGCGNCTHDNLKIEGFH